MIAPVRSHYRGRQVTRSPTPKLRRTRASTLLARVLTSRWFDQGRVADELAVTPATIDGYLSGEIPIPLERQLCLALFVIENVPALARAGHMLRGQVTAAIAFQAHTTVVHPTALPPGPRSF